MTRDLVEALKESGQDFEWYPTTDAMIAAVANHIKGGTERNYWSGSVLDIGAGDGRVLVALAEQLGNATELYAIEKAPIHIENMPAQIAMVGTDFHHQTLIDKDVHVVFSNPPYSEFEDWAVKIIKEALCESAYLILPKRWFDSPVIRAALESRGAKAQIIWSGDFCRAERQARAAVDILYVSLCNRRNRYDHRPEKLDPFDTWFSETFPEVEVLDKLKDETQAPEKIARHLIAGHNLFERLAELYQRDMDKMYASYRALCAVDPAVLKTIGVEVAQIKAGLRAKIKGLKSLYWQELFDHLDKITQRLTSKSRQAIVEKMATAVHVDFTVDNAYAVVLWVVKNANGYINSQLTGLFKELSRPEHIVNYVSNQRTWGQENWRYLHNPSWGQGEAPSRYMLDYRIIVCRYRGIYNGDGYPKSHGIGKYDYPGGLHKVCHTLLGDIITVANNLGYACSDSTGGEWEAGVAREIYLDSGETLMRVRAHINGNLHLQIHQEVIKALNIEASRLLGWIRSPREACVEMGVDFKMAERCFGSNRLFVGSDCKRLTA